MKITTLLGAAAALSISFATTAYAAEAAPSAATPAAKAPPSDQAMIAALEKRFAAGVSAKNANRIMAVYAKQGLFVFDVTPPRQYVGWQAYKKDWETFIAAYPNPIKFTVSDLGVTVSGDVAYSHSIQTIESTDKAGAPNKLVVRVTDVYRKTGDAWWIVQEHVSIPVDLDTGKPDMLSLP
ncbi:MAG: YybH family protein [Phenylobacterium sp.]